MTYTKTTSFTDIYECYWSILGTQCDNRDVFVRATIKVQKAVHTDKEKDILPWHHSPLYAIS